MSPGCSLGPDVCLRDWVTRPPRGLRVDCLMLLQGERPGGFTGWKCGGGGLGQGGFLVLGCRGAGA